MRVRHTLAAAVLLALRRRHAVCVTCSVHVHTSTSPTSAAVCSTDRSSTVGATRPTRRVTPPRLNGRSRRVRDLLLAHAARPATHARDRHEEDDDDESNDDARLLLVEEVMDELRQKTHADTQEMLHPLLCVELLRRLGPAVVTQQHRQGSSNCSSDGRGRRRRRGWAVPCMNAWSTTNSTMTSDTSGSTSGTRCIRTMYEEVVVRPLLPMLTRWAAAQTCETASCVLPAAVRSVLPCLVEWLAVLPCLFVRHITGNEGDDDDEGVHVSEAMWSNVHASWDVIAKYYSKQQQQQIGELRAGKDEAPRMCECAEPALAQLLPYILLTAGTLGEREGAKQGVQADTVVSRLVQLFALVQDDDTLHNTTALQAQRANSRALADVLFWQTDVPLLSCDTARQAYMAYTQPYVEDNTRKSAALPELTEQTTCHTHRCVLRVDVPDDDAFRRFLLRLEALQSTLTRDTTSASKSVRSVVYLVPHLTQCTQHNTEEDDDEDIVLRLVLPLHDYLLAHVPAAGTAEAAVSAVHTSEQGCAVQLGFEGVVHVLTAILDRMQALRRKSKCTDLAIPRYNNNNNNNNTTSDDSEADQLREYTLLPHKPRVHALKRICERLLQHARWAESAARTQTSTPPTASSEKHTTSSVAYFTDVPATMQVAVLRKMCGASRALVRLVMREKQDSLLEDSGGNGNSNSSSSSNNNNNSDVLHGGAMQSGGAVTSRALGEVLRNVAYRLIEPELRRYYETYNVMSNEEEAERGRSMRQGQAATHRAQYEHKSKYENCSYDTAYVRRSSLTSLYTLIGKDGALATARTILRHPSAHPTHALVEALRLIGMHSLLFHHSLHSVDMMHTLARRHENIKSSEELTPMLEELLRGFDCVWHRIAGVAMCTPDHLPNTAEAEPQTSSNICTLPTLSERLLMLVLLVVRQTCLLSCNATRAHAVAGDAEIAENDAAHNMTGAQDVLLRRLLVLWTDNGSRTEWAPFLPFLSYLPQASHHHHSNSDVSLYFPPAALPSGCQERWELIEELRCLATAAATTATSASPTCDVNDVHERCAKGALEVVTWRWLSSAQAIEHSVQDVHAYTSHTHSENTTGGVRNAVPYVLYLLLPWSTLASARHPLRLYDEDGRSAAAAAAFDRTLHHLLLSSCTADTKNETINKKKEEGGRGRDEQQTASHPPLRVVVRLVSLAEELRFFAALATQAELALAPDVLVVQDAESVMAAGQERDVVREILGRRKGQSKAVDQTEVKDDDDDEEGDMYDEFAALD